MRNGTEKLPSRIKNLGIAGILALTGCVSLIVILGALFIGIWVDSRLGTRGPGVVTLLILSVPVSIFLMLRLALALVKQIDFTAPNRSAVNSDKKEE